MPFDDLENEQDDELMRPSAQQFPLDAMKTGIPQGNVGSVPLGMRILNIGAQRFSQPDMPRPPLAGVETFSTSQPADAQRSDLQTGIARQEANPGIGQRIVDLGAKQFPRPDAIAGQAVPMPAGVDPQANQPQGQPQQPGRPNQPVPGGRNQTHARHQGQNQGTGRNVHDLEEQLRLDEGLPGGRPALRPYRDPGHPNQWVIGYGHNLTAHGEAVPTAITPQQADAYHQQDIQEATRNLDRELPWARNLDEARRGALLNMTFAMGIGNARNRTGLLGFPRALEAVRNGHYEQAAQEILNSDWARRQTPARAARLAQQIRTGQWQ